MKSPIFACSIYLFTFFSQSVVITFVFLIYISRFDAVPSNADDAEQVINNSSYHYYS